MRVIYGAFAQGQGHFSKAAVLVPLLEARGCEVLVISSGLPQPPAAYRFRRHRHFPVLAYEVSDGRPDFGATFRKWIKELPYLAAHLFRLRRIVREFRPELILTDFEPLIASPVVDPPCEVIGISRQAALLQRELPVPEGMSFERRLTRSVIRLFTAGADRSFGYHYEPATSRCLPPVLRPQLAGLTPRRGDHLFVYHGGHAAHHNEAESLIRWANRNRQPVSVYGMPQIERGQHGFVRFCPPSRDRMLQDLLTARAAATTAGFTTPVEAFLLGKPVMVVPISHHWEQNVNACHLARAGIAVASCRWDYARLLWLPPPSPQHPLRRWLQTRPERILDYVLHGTPLQRDTDPATRRRPAA